MSTFDLDGYLKERRALVDAALERFLPGEDARRRHRANAVTRAAGGCKRLRPTLVIAARAIRRPGGDGDAHGVRARDDSHVFAHHMMLW